MLEKQSRKIKRMATLITILSKYGFKDVLARMNLKNGSAENSNAESPAAQTSVYVRIRMVLEEMGPSFVKLGQAFSNREDMLPKELIQELQNLQDNVEVAHLDIETILEDNLGTDYKNQFRYIDKTPLASASIAQVYRATLTSGEEVVLKVKRPKIDDVIEDDLLLMKDLARILTAYFDFAENVNLEQAVHAFEKSLLNELSLIKERENIERLAINFKNNSDTYVPKVYPYLSNNEVLFMEFIDGAKITNKEFHTENNLSSHALADKGLQLYLNQILEHGFFHADPHAGNILVMPDGRIVFIDLGAMGSIYHADQELLEDLILNLITKNVSKLVAILKKMAIRIEIKNEKKLHDDIAEILNMVNTSTLEDLKIYVLINKFKDILFENRIIMPDYFTLLVRGLALIESVGRTLNPEMNIIASVEPYVTKIVVKRISPQYLFNKGISKLGDLSQDVQNIPFEIRNILMLLNEGKLTVNSDIKDLQKTNSVIKSSSQDIVLAIILAANIIATALVLIADKEPKMGGMPILSILGFLFSIVLSILLFFKMMKK